jgi:O-antigen/teichoic acid export membrane protein
VEERAIRGIPWTLLSYAANKALRVAATIVLARLLGPDDFGIVALAVLAMAGIHVLSDLGLGGVLVVRQDLDRRAQGTVLSMMIATGAAGTVLVAALAPLAALLFDEPALTGVLVVLSCTVLIRVSGWFYATVLQRELEFRRAFVASVLETLTYIAVALTLAVADAGVWSLVFSDVASAIVLLVALFVLVPYRVRPTIDRRLARELFAEGRGFMVQGGFSFLRQNADYLVVGRAIGTAPLGLYSMAYRIAEIPYWAIVNPIASAIFPGFARMRHRSEDVTRTFATTLRMVALVACPLGVLLSATAEPFTRLLLGETWMPMAGALAVLGIWAALKTIEETSAWFLNSIGKAGLLGRIAALTLVALVPAVVMAGTLGGIVAVSWVVVGDALVTVLVLAWFIDRRADVAAAQQWKALRPVVIACPATWAAAAITVRALDDSPPAVALFVAAAAGTVVYLACVGVAARGVFGDAATGVRRAFGRTSAPASRP